LTEKKFQKSHASGQWKNRLQQEEIIVEETDSQNYKTLDATNDGHS